MVNLPVLSPCWLLAQSRKDREKNVGGQAQLQALWVRALAEARWLFSLSTLHA